MEAEKIEGVEEKKKVEEGKNSGVTELGCESRVWVCIVTPRRGNFPAKCAENTALAARPSESASGGFSGRAHVCLLGYIQESKFIAESEKECRGRFMGGVGWNDRALGKQESERASQPPRLCKS